MSRRTRRRIGTALAVAGVMVASTAAVADAHGRGYVDQQVVQLTRPQTSRGAGGLALHMTARSAVSAANVAVATASCDGCHATAISFQVVVADRAPSSVNAENLAYANDDSCNACDAQAYAYQFVLVLDGDARLSPAGWRQLDRIDDAVRALARSGRSPEDVQVAADGYAAQVADILAAEVRVRPVVRKQAHEQHGPGPASVTRPPGV